MSSILAILSAMAAWGALHSALASFTAKARARHVLGARTADGFYRLAYNAVAVITFLPVMALVGLLPDRPLYRLPAWLLVFTLPLQAAAGLAALVTLVRVDLPRFLGLRQLARWLQGRPDPRDAPHLVTTGIYGWVRHPLYFEALVLIWLSPVMTLNALAFNAGATLYFWIGSIFEERKLVAEFGDAYREHQRRVPRLLPRRPAAG